MRVFLDACIDPRAAELFPGHEVETAFERSLHQLKDHTLLALIQENFDVLVTIDQGFEFEHNLDKVKLGIVIVHVPINRIDYYRALAAELGTAVQIVKPGEVVHVRGYRSSS